MNCSLCVEELFDDDSDGNKKIKISFQKPNPTSKPHLIYGILKTNEDCFVHFLIRALLKEYGIAFRNGV